MRIISGYLKGKKIELPNDKNTRPLKDLVKESIFNIIKHSGRIKKNLVNTKVLDCFSGTGSFGLECISRGAKNLAFIENYPPALKILNKNIKNLKLENYCEVYSEEIFKFSKKKIDKKFDIIFFDPPYKYEKISELFKHTFENKFLKTNGLIILHRHKKSSDNIPIYFNEVECKIYGISKILFYKLNN